MKNYLKKLPKIPVHRNQIHDIPETPGIYVFFKLSKPIYIGKAINLKRRISSYFDIHLGPKTQKMMSEADQFSFIQVTSELEALLLEARLIRTHMPHYNVAAKDDKHPIYILISKEEYPRIITVRKTAINNPNIAVYGPFPSSTNARGVLKMLRRVFPYSDHKIGIRGCLYSHIGLCNPCPSEVTKLQDQQLKVNLRKTYLKNIRKIKSILDGKIENVRKELEREMDEFAKIEDYEEALKVRDQIKRLEYITQPQIPTDYFMENPNLYQDIRKSELTNLKEILKRNGLASQKLNRIECFDIAHLTGVNPTASMVTFIDGEADKKYYRHFKIRQQKGNSDTDSMKEVIKRRKNHFKDWGTPDLIIVDGGKAQVGVFQKELEENEIPIVGIAKRFETLVIPNKANGTTILKEYKLPRSPALNIVQRLRDEAHRFARRYHHKLLSKELTSN
jgi:excinuclease ABC subunit C